MFRTTESVDEGVPTMTTRRWSWAAGLTTLAVATTLGLTAGVAEARPRQCDKLEGRVILDTVLYDQAVRNGWTDLAADYALLLQGDTANAVRMGCM
jgi:hypothetical protein